MTRIVFRDLVLSICRFSGISYLEDAQDVNGLINERIRSFAERTRCLYDDRITFTLTGSGQAGYYDQHGTAFGRDVLEVHRLYIDGQPLRNFQGKYGPVSIEELATYYPTYLTDSPAKPQFFCQIPPRTIRLFPTPDQDYAQCFAAGWYLPAAIAIQASGDSQELDLPEEYQRTAAYWTASALLIPTATGQSDYERMANLNQEAAFFMQELANRSRRQLGGPSIRGAIRYRPGL